MMQPDGLGYAHESVKPPPQAGKNIPSPPELTCDLFSTCVCACVHTWRECALTHTHVPLHVLVCVCSLCMYVDYLTKSAF